MIDLTQYTIPFEIIGLAKGLCKVSEDKGVPLKFIGRKNEKNNEDIFYKGSVPFGSFGLGEEGYFVTKDQRKRILLDKYGPHIHMLSSEDKEIYDAIDRQLEAHRR